MKGPNHTRFIVGCIALISLTCLFLGSALLYAGYQSGELLVQGGSNGLSGLIGFLGGKMVAERPGIQDPSAVSTTTTEIKTP